MATERWSPELLQRARGTITNGWRWRGMDVELDPPIAWDQVCAGNRSSHYHLHAWEFLAPVLPAYQVTGEDRFAQFARELMLDWLSSYPSTETDSPFAWYDMAVGLRAYRLGYILDVSARDPACSNEVVGRLLDGAMLHSTVLGDNRWFIKHTNHGLYQAASQRALALRFPELPGMRDHAQQSRERLAIMLRQQFTDEGVHREHSPGYHYLLLDALERILACELFDAEWLHALADRSREALAWLAQPDGRLPRIGDTDERVVRGPPFNVTPNQALRFVATEGAEGYPPHSRIRAFPKSGYAVMRDRWPTGPDNFGNGVHLVQICGFHSRAHKHADDLSFVWYEQGGPVLDDSGRYGYLGRITPTTELAKLGFMYSDPKRVYVESTRAHNTVEIDRTSYARRIDPPGSMLRAWGDSNGVCWTQAEAKHGTVRHIRALILRPGAWLLVVDWLHDEEGQRHYYSQRFHAAPEHDVEVAAQAVRFKVPQTSMPLHGIPLLDARFTGVVRGQEEPELLGWTSRTAQQFEPAPTFAWEAGRAASHTFATLFSWGKVAPTPDPERTHVETERIAAQFTWRTSEGPHSVLIESDDTRKSEAVVRYGFAADHEPSS